MSSPYPTALLNKRMAAISEVVDAVERSLRLSREDTLTYVAELIRETDICVEIDDNGQSIPITDNQRGKTRVEDGRVKTGFEAEIVRLSFITPGFDAENESCDRDRVSAPTKTTPKPGREPTISTHRVYEEVRRCLEAEGIMARNVRSPAGLRRGPKIKLNYPEICAAVAFVCCHGKAINIPNQSKFIGEVKDCLVHYYGYDEEDLPGTTMLKGWASVVMKLFLQVDEKDEEEGGR